MKGQLATQESSGPSGSVLPCRSGPSGPLTGVRVIDMSAYIAGPYGCTLLADQGAEIIKVEPPAGDNLRKYPSSLETESRAFLGVNRSKLATVLDIKQPEDLAILLTLIESADVLVHNFRPTVAPRIGIGYEQLKKLNPRLIYCAVSGYGETGPLKDKAGFDQVLQTMTGMAAQQGKKGGPPEVLYGSVVDFYASALVAGAVSSALFERERSGLGQFVGVSLLDAAMTMQSTRLIWAEQEGRDVARDMRSGGITGIHPTKDGFIYISANTPHFWQALCEKTGMAEFIGNERFDTVRKRAQHHAEIVPKLHQALAAKSALEWEALFGEEVPCAAARCVEDMFDHPQVLNQGLIATYQHPVVGQYRGLKRSVRFARTPGPEPFAAPTLGQHTEIIKAEAARLRRNKNKA